MVFCDVSMAFDRVWHKGLIFILRQHGIDGDLGLTFSSNGKWHKHIENILNSAAKVVGIMRKLKFTLNRIALNQIYVSYVLQIIEYSSVV